MKISHYEPLWHLLREVKLPPEAQLAVLQKGGQHVELLTANRSTEFTDDVWHELWNVKKLPAQMACNLAARRLPNDRIEMVLANEKRVTPLEALAVHNRLSEDQLRRAMATCHQLAARLPRDPKWSCGMHRDVMVATGGVDALLALVNHSFTDAEARQVLRQWASGTSRRRHFVKQLLVAILAKYPLLIDEFCADSATDSMRLVAAGSSLLVDTRMQKQLLRHCVDGEPHMYLATALLSNPRVGRDIVDAALLRVCQPEQVADQRCMKIAEVADRRLAGIENGTRPQVTVPFDQVADPAVVSWLVSRSLPNPVGRPFDLVTLAYNPNITDRAARELLWGLKDSVVLSMVGVPTARRTFDDLTKAFGGSIPVPGIAENTNPFTIAERYVSHRWESPAVWSMPQTTKNPGEVLVKHLNEASAWLSQPDGAGLETVEQWSMLMTLLVDIDEDKPLGDVVAAAKMLAA